MFCVSSQILTINNYKIMNIYIVGLLRCKSLLLLTTMTHTAAAFS
jgi:hypothetical protein